MLLSPFASYSVRAACYFWRVPYLSQGHAMKVLRFVICLVRNTVTKGLLSDNFHGLTLMC